MAITKGLASIKRQQAEQRERAEASNRPKADWFKWPKGVNVATVRFLQELDAEMEGYREDRGVGFIATEHQAPGNDGWKRRALCTIDDGECYACERHKQDYKAGWRQRQNLYINALVQFGNDDPRVMIIQRNANSTFTQALIEEYEDEPSITSANYRITRTGEGTQTQWLLKRLKGEPFNDGSAEVFDLEQSAIRNVEYEKQPEYFAAVLNEDVPTVSTTKSAAPSAAVADDEW